MYLIYSDGYTSLLLSLGLFSCNRFLASGLPAWQASFCCYISSTLTFTTGAPEVCMLGPCSNSSATFVEV